MVPYAPWIIQRTDLTLPAVQAVVQGVRTGRHQRSLRLRQPEGPGQASAEPIVAASGEPPSLKLRSGEW